MAAVLSITTADSSRREAWQRDDTLFAAAAAAVAVLMVAAGVEFYWLRDLKFDDAWIHFRYAENVAHGKGFVYNEGERVLGSGSVAWDLILALLARMATPDTLSYAVSVLNYVTLLGCGAVLYLVLRGMMMPWLSLAIAGLLLSHGPVLISSMGGMETTLLCLLYYLTLLALLRERYVLAALCAGMAVCLRVESLALLGATVLAALFHRRRTTWAVASAGAALPLLASAWAWAYFGSPLPNSTLAKNTVNVAPPHYAIIACFKSLLDVFAFDRLIVNGSIHPVLAHCFGLAVWLALVEMGYLVLKRRSRAASLVVIQVGGALVFYAVTNPLMFPWYTCTFVPLATLLATLGMWAIARNAPGLRSLPNASLLIIVVVASCVSLRTSWWPFRPPDDGRFSFWVPNALEHSRTYQYVKVARWLNERSQPADRVCISEIGAFGYHYRGRILDGIGLVSPEVLPYHPLPDTMRPNGIVGAIPPRVVRDFRPEFVVSLDVFAGALFEDPWFNEHYRLIGRWPWFGGPARWHDLPASIWRATEIRAYRRLDAGPNGS